MGGKRTWKRKLIYLCIASLICFGLWGCAGLIEKRKVELIKEEVREEEVGEEVGKEEIGIDSVQKEEVPQKEVQKKEDSPQPPSEPLSQAKELLAQRDYGGSLKESQKILSLAGKDSPGDEALFHIGLIYAHPNNPKKDYRKSLRFFKRITRDYPQSPLIEQARIWIGILQEHERLNKTVEKYYQMIEESKRVDIEIEERKREKGK